VLRDCARRLGRAREGVRTGGGDPVLEAHQIEVRRVAPVPGPRCEVF
jgi:hypothetical protein